MALETPRCLEEVSFALVALRPRAFAHRAPSFPFGWLFLPVDLIGRPFSQKTRDHFLPLLTSTAWWSQTQLALRRVFQIDPDFQERMFARQIAVMKGQAWNVVETLKTLDHGPLELTRRAKVCVWDDLVEVPVAVPMRAASFEVRRRGAPSAQSGDRPEGIEEEMDIGAVNAGASDPSVVDLLGNASPPADLPHPGRFELTETPVEETGPSPDELFAGIRDSPSAPTSPERRKKTTAERPSLPRSAMGGNASFSGPPRASLNMYTPKHERRYSFATAVGRRNSNSIAQQLYGAGHGQAHHGRPSFEYYPYDEDVDGDLGYAAAEGMEGNRRKVIVERLEPVKSKNPVFTWC